MSSVFEDDSKMSCEHLGDTSRWEHTILDNITTGNVSYGDVARLIGSIHLAPDTLPETAPTLPTVTADVLSRFMVKLLELTQDSAAEVYTNTLKTVMDELKITDEHIASDPSCILAPVARALVNSTELTGLLLRCYSQGVVFGAHNRLLCVLWCDWMHDEWTTERWEVVTERCDGGLRTTHHRTDELAKRNWKSPSVTLHWTVAVDVHLAAQPSVRLSLSKVHIGGLTSSEAKRRAQQLHSVVQRQYKDAVVSGL